MCGELQGSVYAVDTPAKLFDIRQVTVEADTIGGHVADATKLAALIERFRREPDGWRDEALIAEMIGLARRTGDVTRVPISLPAMTFEQGNFWTSLFGGVYVFRSVKFPAAISRLPMTSLGKVPIPQVMDFTHRNHIADWLDRNQLVEPIVQARGADAGRSCGRRWISSCWMPPTGWGSRWATRGGQSCARSAFRIGSALPEEFLGLAAILRWVEGGALAEDFQRAPGLFLFASGAGGARPRSGEHALSELAPMDVRQMFITHKERFYEDYATWSAAKQTHVADFLAREYQVDREGAREALFGPEPRMDELARPEMQAGPKPVRGAGPWGSAGGGARNTAPPAGPWGSTGGGDDHRMAAADGLCPGRADRHLLLRGPLFPQRAAREAGEAMGRRGP